MPRWDRKIINLFVPLFCALFGVFCALFGVFYVFLDVIVGSSGTHVVREG